MTAPLITLNATVAEIEDALLTGKRVQDVARDLAEPPNNVYGVYCSLVERGKIHDTSVPVTKRPDLTVARQASSASQATGRPGSASPRPVPAPSPPPGPPVTGGGAEPSIDALVNAAARSTSKRTQALGVKLAELATVVRQWLREERDAAEKAQREKAVRDAATAEVARLEAELAEARAKLVGGRRSKGVGSAARVQSARNAAATAVAKAEANGPYVCQKGCGREFGYPDPRGSHEKRCTGGAS